MGSSRFDDDDWVGYTVKTASTPIDKIYTSKSMKSGLDPKGITRESCDSTVNPNSTPIIIAVDNTGSMGILSETIIRKGLGVVMNEIYSRKPVSDPHLLIASVGDADYDKSPLQVTQFEAGTKELIDQVTQIYIERGGGGNGFESYNLPWYFAANHTKCDNFIKRQQKGFLFTVGDESPPPTLRDSHIRSVFGDQAETISSRDLLTQVQKSWEVYHIVIEQGSGSPSYRRGYSSMDDDKHGIREWRKLLGERVIPLSDHNKLAEVIVSILEVVGGKKVDDVAKSWSGDTALVVHKSISSLANTTKDSAKSGVTRF